MTPSLQPTSRRQKENFTYPQFENTWARVACWSRQNSFYVQNIDSVLDALAEDLVPNSSGCIQLNFGEGEGDMKLAWSIVSALIAHQRVLDIQLTADGTDAE